MSEATLSTVSYRDSLKRLSLRLQRAINKYLKDPCFKTYLGIVKINCVTCPIYCISAGKYNNQQCNHGCPLRLTIRTEDVMMTPCTFVACGGNGTQINEDYYHKYGHLICFYILKFKLFHESLNEN